MNSHPSLFFSSSCFSSSFFFFYCFFSSTLPSPPLSFSSPPLPSYFSLFCHFLLPSPHPPPFFCSFFFLFSYFLPPPVCPTFFSSILLFFHLNLFGQFLLQPIEGVDDRAAPVDCFITGVLCSFISFSAVVNLHVFIILSHSPALVQYLH